MNFGADRGTPPRLDALTPAPSATGGLAALLMVLIENTRLPIARKDTSPFQLSTNDDSGKL